MRFIWALVFWIVVAIIGYFIFAFSGRYEVGADVPHWKITENAIDMVREHAVDHRIVDIQPPPLDDPALVKLGAQHYAEMCVGCHLAPGITSSELREGLYPRPPNLTRFSPDPAEAFWIIKHGLKMTAMPAWGASHDDHTIWAMVAYLQKQPKLSPEEFHALKAGAGDEDGHEHSHTMGAASGMAAPATTTAPPAAASTTP